LFEEVSVSAHIRGHYRIDSSGRVEPMTDVNGPALKMRVPPPLAPNQYESRWVKISIAGIVALTLGIGGALAIPQIQQRFMSAQAANFASVRHLHGHHLRAMAARLLHRDESPQDQ
jgi:hypothetical protein